MKQRRERRALAEAALQEKEARAAEIVERGREAGDAMGKAVDQFIALRARPIAEALFGVYSKQLANIDVNGERSPIDIARAESRIFMEELGGFQDRLTAECHEYVAEWMALADETGIRDLFETLIRNRMADLYMELFERTINRSAEVVEAYKTAGFKAVLTAD